MSEAQRGYILFSVVLVALYLAVPVFPLSHVLVTCLAVFSVVKFISKLSTMALSTIVVVVTIALPMATLYLIGHELGMSPLDKPYLTPVNAVQWILPTLSSAILVWLLKRRTRA